MFFLTPGFLSLLLNICFANSLLYIFFSTTFFPSIAVDFHFYYYLPSYFFLISFSSSLSTSTSSKAFSRYKLWYKVSSSIPSSILLASDVFFITIFSFLCNKFNLRGLFSHLLSGILIVYLKSNYSDYHWYKSALVAF
uniref:Uncharacterized protein n=1 Tax=Cacopsylla melanoneura TaxID=428564 RepID=A0A8D9AVP7_9HEMI